MSKSLHVYAVGSVSLTVMALLAAAAPGVASYETSGRESVGAARPATERGSYSDLAGVTALSATNAWAVGVHGPGKKRHAMIQHWDGTGWSTVTNGGRGHGKSYLKSVSAVAPDDVWAVGETEDGGVPLAEHWDGTAWSQVAAAPVPIGSIFKSVVAVSADDVWAVGSYLSSSFKSRTLVEHWDGTSWIQVAAPSPGPNGPHGAQLSGISAVSADDVWAVGKFEPDATSQYHTLVIHWDGTEWTRVAAPNPGGTNRSELDAVSARAVNDVWAVGSNDAAAGDTSVVLHWDGADWTQIASPNPGAYYNPLVGVTAVSATDAWAVGSSFTSATGLGKPLNLHWDGTSWTKVASTGPHGSFGSRLFGVAGSGSTDVWAVGAGTPKQYFKPVIQHWDGTSWTTL